MPLTLRLAGIFPTRYFDTVRTTFHTFITVIELGAFGYDALQYEVESVLIRNTLRRTQVGVSMETVADVHPIAIADDALLELGLDIFLIDTVIESPTRTGEGSFLGNLSVIPYLIGKAELRYFIANDIFRGHARGVGVFTYEAHGQISITSATLGNAS